MKSGLTVFSLGVAGIAAAAAMVAPPPAEAPAANEAAAPPPPIATRETMPPRAASQPGVMVSNSTSGPAVSVRMRVPNPPIVAIPRIPGPADLMEATGQDGEVRTIRSFSSNEACDEALPRYRGNHPDAFCVSTTIPQPPEYGFLVEVDVEKNEIVTLETHPSMSDCRQVLAGRTPRPGIQSACTPKLH
jgi:hypothetical protein